MPSISKLKDSTWSNKYSLGTVGMNNIKSMFSFRLSKQGCQLTVFIILSLGVVLGA